MELIQVNIKENRLILCVYRSLRIFHSPDNAWYVYLIESFPLENILLSLYCV